MLLRFFGISLGGSFLFASFVYLKILFSPSLNTKSIDKEKDKTPTEKYIEKYKKRFEKSYHNDIFNQNIQKDFYNKELYNQAIKLQDNSLENSWKQRKLFENTPNGNVVMFYDAFRLSFSYYSDNHIPYPVLNAVAMKYVITYFCRDFFLDKFSIPINHTTPFLYVHEIDKKESTTKKIDVSKGPFVKLKNYTKTEKEKDTKKDKEEKKKDNKPVKNYIKNKFISLGKMYNFSLLKNTRVLNTWNKPKEANPINYDAFKKWNNPEPLSLINPKDSENTNYAAVFS